ncbi:MAG: PQQ-binding-like beta-propeller repeat protein [Candidatus Eremiobacteraeota bacterium]|nr:PQQ-binding-like beta-propeller repeat protein [Candidatus Eremiobacteraeota bacterium]
MNIRSTSLLSLSFAVGLASCGQAGSSLPGTPGANPVTQSAPVRASVLPAITVNWPQQGMNPAHTGYNAHETTLGAGNVGGLTQLWSFPTGGQIMAPVLLQNGVAYVNSGDGYLYALNATTGAQLWKFQTYEGAGSQTNPVISGAHVFVPCLVGDSTQQNGICALKLANGSLAWSFYADCNCLPPAAVSEAPVVSGTTLLLPYYFPGGFQLIALGTSSGTVLWTYVYPGGNSGGPSPSAPAIDGNSAYIGEGYNDAVCSLALSNGAVNWCTPTGDSINAPAVWKGVVYANTYSHGVFAFNASSGAQLWQYTPTAGNYSGQDDPPAIANGKVFVAGVGFSGNLYALKASTGALIYHTSAGTGGDANTFSSPSIANGVAYVECQTGVCAFNAKNGKLLFTPNGMTSSQSSPAVLNGVLYDTCGPNAMCAYSLPANRTR